MDTLAKHNPCNLGKLNLPATSTNANLMYSAASAEVTTIKMPGRHGKHKYGVDISSIKQPPPKIKKRTRMIYDSLDRLVPNRRNYIPPSRAERAKKKEGIDAVQSKLWRMPLESGLASINDTEYATHDRLLDRLVEMIEETKKVQGGSQGL